MVIEVHGLNKTFKSSLLEPVRKVLQDVSFSIEMGKTTGFVGVNGSGKTTTLKCILGFLQPDPQSDLKIRFFGEEAATGSFRSRIGYLPERPFLYDYLTAEEFLEFHWKLGGGREGFEQKCKQALERVNLPGVQGKRIRQFSKGMMQRIGFAQALLMEPELLILDEPMSGLDPDGRFLIKEIIKEEARKGTSIFFSSHYLGDIEELSQALVIIDQGKIIYKGSTSELISRYSPKYRISTRDPGQEKATDRVVEVARLAPTLSELQSKGSEILHVAPDFVALETAFHELRGRKDSGS